MLSKVNRRELIRLSVPANSLLTHTVRPKVATPYAPPSAVRVREVTLWSVASIRESEPSMVFATQTAPSPNAIPDGPLPTLMVASVSRVAGLMRLTVPSPWLVTHSDPPPAATPVGPPPTGMTCRTSPVRRSSSVRLASRALVTQTAPAATTTPVGPAGTG